MDEIRYWLTEFVKRRRLETPDGRPIYAYRCTQGELDELREHLRPTTGPYNFDPSPHWNQGFCLYAAEWWRRNHEGGPWKWEGLLGSIWLLAWAPEGPRYNALQQAVKVGLDRWNRPLLRSSLGRLFLVTLACEGGLPLKLILNEQARLRAYFRALLHLFHATPHADSSSPELAESVALILPRSLRHEIVYRLCGQLIDAVIELQHHVAGAVDPVVALDAHHPTWRDELPLRVDDDVARAFLNSLIQEAVNVVATAGRAPRWLRSLRRVDTQWHLVGQLDLPARLSAANLGYLFVLSAGEDNQIPGRFELGLEVAGSGYETIAVATARRGPDQEQMYVLDHARRATMERFGPEAAAPRVLIARIGPRTLRKHEFFGATELSGLPWVFEQHDSSDGSLRFAGEGTTRVRSMGVVVALPRSAEVRAHDGASIEWLGELQGLERSLVRIRGAATVDIREHDTGESISSEIRTDDRDAGNAVQYLLWGARPFSSIYLRDVFVGPPCVFQQQEDGQQQRVNDGQVWWRPTTMRHGWKVMSPACRGDVALRLVRGGAVHFSTRAKVLPPGSRIAYRAHANAIRAGEVDFAHVGSPSVRLAVGQNGITAQTSPLGPEGVRLTVSCVDIPPDSFQVELLWSDEGPPVEEQMLSLHLPFPIPSGRFRDGSGAFIPDGALVSVRTLAGIIAEAVIPGHNPNAFVDGDYVGEDIPPEIVNAYCVWEPMNNVEEGHFEYDLAVLRERLEALLDATEDIDGYFRLRIASNDAPGMPPRRLNVARFDAALRLDNERGVIYLSNAPQDGSNRDRLLKMRLEAFPLTVAGPKPLTLVSQGEVGWAIPWSQMKPGPWLVVGWDGDWCRPRPCLVIVPSQAPLADSVPPAEPIRNLAEACHLGSREARMVEIERLLGELAVHGEDSNWDLVEDHLAWCRDLPAVTFDIVTTLARVPSAATMAAVRARAEDFQNLWTTLETLPFLWRLVPVRIWGEVLRTRVESLRNTLNDISDELGGLDPSVVLLEDFNRVTANIISAQPVLRAAIEIWREEMFQIPRSPETRLPCSLLGRRWLLRQREEGANHLLDRSPDFHRWPQSDTLRTLPDRLRNDHLLDTSLPGWEGYLLYCNFPEKFTLLNAPVMAALLALTEESVWRAAPAAGRTRRKLVGLFKSLRAFDEAWFDNAYDMTFLSAFGELTELRGN